MENLRELLESMFVSAVVQGSQMSGMNTNQLIPIYIEFIAFQMYQLAPMELEEWIKLIPEQCKQPTVIVPALSQAREDLTLTLEMVTNS
jgi:riboflavin transporter FmnP